MSWFEENWLRVILAVTSTGTLGIAVRIYSIWRKGRSDDAQLELKGDEGIRAHWAAELTALREQIVKSGDAHALRSAQQAERYEQMLRAADERHAVAMRAADEREALCHKEVRELRDEIRLMGEEIVGLRRQLAQSGKSAIVLATHAPSQAITEAADHAVEALDRLESNLGGKHDVER